MSYGKDVRKRKKKKLKRKLHTRITTFDSIDGQGVNITVLFDDDGISVVLHLLAILDPIQIKPFKKWEKN
jgi:hypothetical protein